MTNLKNRADRVSLSSVLPNRTVNINGSKENEIIHKETMSDENEKVKITMKMSDYLRKIEKRIQLKMK